MTLRSEAPSGGEPRSAGPRLLGLLILNTALLVLLGVVTFGAAADAQPRVRADYVMVAGGVNGLLGDAVYVVDTSNQEMIALTYDPNTKQVAGIGYRNLQMDAATLNQAGRPR